jgi:hypothetical protein
MNGEPTKAAACTDSGWQKIEDSETPPACNHVDLVPILTVYPCGRQAAWRRKTSCGCGAIHGELLRCHEHRIAELQNELGNREMTVRGLIRFARGLDHDIRTDDECILRAAGYEQTPRDEGDELWHQFKNLPFSVMKQ